MKSPRVLSVRALNRALLERQWLSGRVRKAVPEYDNAFIAHADRARIVAPADLPAMRAENGFLSPFLVDGFVRGTWRVARRREAVTLELRPTRRLAAPERVALEEEGLRLLAFLSPESRARDVRVVRA